MREIVVLSLRPRVGYGGGGPTNAVPQEYLDETHRLSGIVAGPEWAEWWAGLGLDVITSIHRYNAQKCAVRLRVTGRTATIGLDRPASTIPAGAAAAAMARDDLEAVLAKVQSRFEAGAYPVVADPAPEGRES